MSNYREIVTKTIVGKGRKAFSSKHLLTPENNPDTVLGCWVINHLITLGDKLYKIVILSS